ncbi:hypothetical protein ACFL0L_00725 [Patescibacteria group bacterium]
MSNVNRTSGDLKKELVDQLELLKKLVELYDKGTIVAAKSIATTIRVLVHDTTNSRSLAGQLDMKKLPFFDTIAFLRVPSGPNIIRAGSFAGLLYRSNKGPTPMLDRIPRGEAKYVPFSHFWNRVVFTDNYSVNFTRSDVILDLANKDGGAHVDPKLDEKYINIARKNSMGWFRSSDGKSWFAEEGVIYATVRQIGHEILRSFVLDYPKKQPAVEQGILMSGQGIYIEVIKSRKK